MQNIDVVYIGIGVVVYTLVLLAAEVCRLWAASLAVEATPSHALW